MISLAELLKSSKQQQHQQQQLKDSHRKILKKKID
jgi:hypothetical protein